MKNVLVVDDEVEIVNSLKEYLSDKGFNVTGCNAAEEAYTLYNNSQPDLVLSDIKMPGKSGPPCYRRVIPWRTVARCYDATGRA